MDERGGKEDPGFKGTTSNRKEGRGEEGWEGREEKEMGKDERGGEEKRTSERSPSSKFATTPLLYTYII